MLKNGNKKICLNLKTDIGLRFRKYEVKRISENSGLDGLHTISFLIPNKCINFVAILHDLAH